MLLHCLPVSENSLVYPTKIEAEVVKSRNWRATKAQKLRNFETATMLYTRNFDKSTKFSQKKFSNLNIGKKSGDWGSLITGVGNSLKHDQNVNFFISWGFYPLGLLCAGAFIWQGFCPLWLLPVVAFARCGFCLLWLSSVGAFIRWGFYPLDFLSVRFFVC